MTRASDILALARAEIGTKEDPPDSNRVKYNTAYYGSAVSGEDLSWCAVFIWWLFQQAGAPELYYGGEKTAYVPTLLAWAREQGLTVDTPQPGDLVCFDFDGDGIANHIGVCESCDASYVTTIDGNTGNESEDNGGEVMRRRREKRYILGVIRPKYDREVEEVTQEQFNAMMDVYLKDLAQQKPSAWSEQARKWAEENGVIAGHESGDKQYRMFCTREELVQFLYNTKKL